MNKTKILLVDDDKITRDEFVHIFQNSKYLLDTASNSIEGQSKILETEFDLVMLDIRMPDLSNRFSETAGLELLDWIKREKPLLAVIMLSAINEVKIAVKAMKSSAKDYITKDNFKTEELFSKIDDILLSDVISLIKRGESEVVEFKSSLRYDFASKRANKDLGKVIAKTISGFMNSDGGYLFIGISDNGEPTGIQNDIDILSKKTYDAFLSALFQLVIDYIGKEYCQKIHPSLTEFNKIKVCVVRIERCNKPAWFKDRDVQTFYIRVGQSTRPLDAKDTYEYISGRF